MDHSSQYMYLAYILIRVKSGLSAACHSALFPIDNAAKNTPTWSMRNNHHSWAVKCLSVKAKSFWVCIFKPFSWLVIEPRILVNILYILFWKKQIVSLGPRHLQKLNISLYWKTPVNTVHSVGFQPLYKPAISLKQKKWWEERDILQGRRKIVSQELT